jgi:tyrosine-protein kinase Tec
MTISFILGVLMWEIFTCGKMPYGRLKNTEVVDRVQRGIILEKPKMCFKEVYEVDYYCFNILLISIINTSIIFI